jgi:hypothetical protein
MHAPPKSARLLLAALAATVSPILLVGRAAADTETTGFLIINPWLDDSSSGFPLDPPDGVGWTFNAPWEFEDSLIGFLGAALLPTSSNNPVGIHAAQVAAVDLTSQPNVTSLEGYDASSTRLTGLTFERPWRVGHFGAVPQDGDYTLYMEFTMATTSGSYRASTNRLDRPAAFQNTIAQLPFSFTWETEGYLGDPFAAGGVPLDQILDIDYALLVEVISPTSGGTGFFNAEGFNILYEVSSASASAAAGDFNGDGFVDAADYTAWRDNEGAAESSLAVGSTDGSGLVDAADYDLWVVNYGQNASASGVPEPSTLAVIVTACLMVPTTLVRSPRAA